MANPENDLDVYYAVGNANTKRQENEIGLIIKKRNSAGWRLVSTSNAIVDTKKNFQIYTYFGKSKKTSKKSVITTIPRGLTKSPPVL